MKQPIIYVDNDHEQSSQRLYLHLIDAFKQYPNGLFCFAGGDTPIRVLSLLVQAHHQQVIDLSQAYYIQLDEWVGIDPLNPGSCSAYLRKNFIVPAGIDEHHCFLFDTRSSSLETLCQQADAFIDAHKGIDVAFLGVGVNGHLGFNEPNTSWSLKTHVTKLSESTTSVGTKYFHKDTIIPSKGITLGLSSLMSSSLLLLQLTGETKRESLLHIKQGIPLSEWPVTACLNHLNCSIFTDLG